MAIAFYIESMLVVDLTNKHYEEELIYIMMLIHGISIECKNRYLGLRKDER